jgi:colanic acid/amylovoran biosynthesis glycosyltransferase
LLDARPWPFRKMGTFLKDGAALCISAARYGAVPFAKTAYVLIKAWNFGARETTQYDHILAFWANYSGTCAYVFRDLLKQRIPFSIYPHANVDLYRNQVYLSEKLKTADHIIVDCEFNKEFIGRLYPQLFPSLEKRIYVYHPGVDLNEFAYEPDGRLPATIIGVGRLVKQKGFDDLLRTARELKRRQVEFELELIGDGKEAGALHKLAQQLDVVDKVKFRGWFNAEQVREVMQRATLLVHPSPHIGDAVPNVIKEAMALGTPVVATRVAGIPEILEGGRSGMLVDPRNITALADAVQMFLADASLRKQYAERARSFAEQKFNLWQNGRALADLLRSSDRTNFVSV